MNYPVDGHRAKVERAKKHLVDLKTEVARFLGENPYNAFEEDDPQRRQRVVRARVKPLSTIGLSLLAGDTVHNARSAFDHLARRLVLSNGGPATGDTKFPVFTDKAGFESQGLKKNIKGAHQGAIALVTLLQPYETRKRGEPDHLYILNRLDNFDKHRALNVVGCGLAAVRWDMRPTTGKDP